MDVLSHVLGIPKIGGGGGGGVGYLLRDLFTTPLAAGSVNGTASEPGPGTRGVVDTVGTNVSITGGEIVIAAGNGAFGNAGWWLTTGITREAGRVLKLDFNLPTLSATTASIHLGWHTAANGALPNNLGLIIDANGAFSCRRSSAANSPVVGTLAAATQYVLYEVLRVQGSFFFLKVGSVYRLLYEHQFDTTATLYPHVTARNTTSKINTTELAVPELVFAVSAEASDSFNRADGALGSTDGAGHLEANSGSGKAWVDDVGTWAIATNVAAASALSGGLAIATVDTSKADVYAQAKLTRAGDNVGLVVRYTDANNYVYAYHDGTNATLRKVVGGVDSEVIAATAAPFAAGAKMEIICEGTAFQLFYNQIRIGTGTISDAALQSGTKQGLYSTNTGNTFNDFVVYKRTGWEALGAA